MVIESTSHHTVLLDCSSSPPQGAQPIGEVFWSLSEPTDLTLVTQPEIRGFDWIRARLRRLGGEEQVKVSSQQKSLVSGAPY